MKNKIKIHLFIQRRTYLNCDWSQGQILEFRYLCVNALLIYFWFVLIYYGINLKSKIVEWRGTKWMLFCFFFYCFCATESVFRVAWALKKQTKILKIVNDSSVNLNSTTRVSVAYLDMAQEKKQKKQRKAGKKKSNLLHLNEHRNPTTKQYFRSETLRQNMIRNKEGTVFRRSDVQKQV